MADKIRGLTVEISADATQFKKSMNDCRTAAKNSQQELNALQKSLELKFDSATFVRAQKVAQDALDQTAKNAEILRERLRYLEESGNVDTSEYAKLTTELAQTEAKLKQIQQQLEKIKATKLNALSEQFTKVGNAVTGVGQALLPVSGIAAGALTGLGALGAKAIKTGDEIATLATQYDMTATALQRFNYVALQTDTSAEDLYKGFVKVRGGLADIATGASSKASKALQALNVDFSKLDGTEEQFYAIVAALSSMEDKTQMVAVANDIFGDKLANSLLPLLNAGTSAVQTYCAEFDELGAMTDEQVAALAEFDNVLNKIKTQFANVAVQIGASLLPIMQTLAKIVSETLVPKMQQLAEWFGNLTEKQQRFAVAALAVVAALAPLTMGIGKLISGIGSIIKLLPQIGTALTALEAHPIIAIIGLIAMILILLYTRCEALRDSINNLLEVLGQALQPALDAIMQVLDLVMAILTPIIDMVGGILAGAINAVSDALQPVIGIIQTIFTALQPLLDILTSTINMILAPIMSMLQVLLNILQPILNVCLIPLRLQLQFLQVPLKAIGTLLGWLAPLFQVFGNIVNKIFGGVVKVINIVLGVIETAVNWIISKLNKMIDGVNNTLGWLGVHIDRIADVKLRIDTTDIDSMDDVHAVIDSTAPNTDDTAPNGAYDKVTGTGVVGDVYNNDYSTNTKTQNVTVVIQNYAQDVDVDDMVRQINMKLAEAM